MLHAISDVFVAPLLNITNDKYAMATSNVESGDECGEANDSGADHERSMDVWREDVRG